MLLNGVCTCISKLVQVSLTHPHNFFTALHAYCLYPFVSFHKCFAHKQSKDEENQATRMRRWTSLTSAHTLLQYNKDLMLCLKSVLSQVLGGYHFNTYLIITIIFPN
uniref:Uncharacterized protein n=1 Tax=Kalanchoe fedtschenkoi TaxID=63787 RepID=A0A7N0SXR9_KALFE